MFDGDGGGFDWNFDGYTGRPTWGRVAFKLFLLYLVVACCCWEEVHYRRSAVEVTGRVEWVRPYRRCGSIQVRYTFTAPDTGRRRLNTVTLPSSRKPSGQTVTIQYIPGESSRSRLAVQARPSLVAVFMWINIGIAALVVGYVGYVAWEYHHEPLGHLSPRERAIERFNRRRKLEREFQR